MLTAARKPEPYPIIAVDFVVKWLKRMRKFDSFYCKMYIKQSNVSLTGCLEILNTIFRQICNYKSSGILGLLIIAESKLCFAQRL